MGLAQSRTQPNQNLPDHVANYPNIQDADLQSILWHEQYIAEERMLLKMMLQILGYPMEPQDPLWSPTDAATVKSFQRDHRIRVDGKIGPETMGYHAQGHCYCIMNRYLISLTSWIWIYCPQV